MVRYGYKLWSEEQEKLLMDIKDGLIKGTFITDNSIIEKKRRRQEKKQQKIFEIRNIAKTQIDNNIKKMEIKIAELNKMKNQIDKMDVEKIKQIVYEKIG